MWRVVLSVAAAGYDGLMLAIWAAILPTLLHPRPLVIPPHAVVASSNVQHATQAVTVAIWMFYGGGFALNLLAIAFGARLKAPRRASRSDVAAEFG
jgi:hypothetical protein